MGFSLVVACGPSPYHMWVSKANTSRAELVDGARKRACESDGKEVPSHSTIANAEVTLWRWARSTVEKLGTHCRHNHQTWDGRGFDIWVWLPESPIHKTNLDSDCWCHSIHGEDLMHLIVHNTLKFVTTNWATMTVHFALLTGYIFVNHWAAYTEWVIISVHWLSNGNSKGWVVCGRYYNGPFTHSIASGMASALGMHLLQLVCLQL